MMRLDLATDDFIGARSQQQDAAAARSIGSEGGAMLVLADGLGGHTGGAEASRIVIETFGAAADLGTFDEELDRRPGLRATLEKANERIANGVEPAHGQRGMASTAVAAILADGLVNWISVGDSHLYVWRRGRLAKLNEDHSQAGLMVRSGQFKPDDPEVVASKSILVSALTGRKLEIVDQPAKAFAVQKGDVLLLASDGLNTLSEQEIETAVTEVQAQGATHVSAALLDKVRDRRADRQDNTAVVVACVVDMAERTAEIATQIADDTQRVTAPTELASPTAKFGSAAAKTPANDVAQAPVPARGVTAKDLATSAGPAGAAGAPQAAPPRSIAGGLDATSAEAVTVTSPPLQSQAPAETPLALPVRHNLPPGLIAKLLLGLAIATAAAGTYLFWKPAAPAPETVPTEKRSGAGKVAPVLVQPPAPAVAPRPVEPAAVPAVVPVSPAQSPPSQDTARPEADPKPAASEPTRTPGATSPARPEAPKLDSPKLDSPKLDTPKPPAPSQPAGSAAPAAPPVPQLIEPLAPVRPRGSSVPPPPQPDAPVRSLLPAPR